MDLTNVIWRKSTRSGTQAGNCVEVAEGLPGDTVAVRDSKDLAGPVLTFPSRGWAAFVAGIKRGTFDR